MSTNHDSEHEEEKRSLVGDAATDEHHHHHHHLTNDHQQQEQQQHDNSDEHSEMKSGENTMNNNNNNTTTTNHAPPETDESSSTSVNGLEKEGATTTTTAASDTNDSTNGDEEEEDSSEDYEDLPSSSSTKQKGSVSLIITAKNKSKVSYTKPDAKKQREKIESLESKSSFKAGSTFVIISTSWLKVWKEHVNYPNEHVGKKKQKELLHKKSPAPGPIDNSDIIQDFLIYSGFSLKHPLISEFSNFTRDGSVLFTTLLKRDTTRQDYDFISEESYDLLAHWYGEINTSQKIVRRVIVDGLENNQMRRVETHPYVLNIYMINDKGTIMKDTKTTIQVSKKMMTKDLKMLGCVLFDSTIIQKPSNLKNCRMWRKEDSSASSIADSESQTLERALIFDGQSIVFEFKQNGGEFPLETFKKKQESNASDDEGEDDEDDEDKRSKLSEIWDSIKDYSFSTFGIATPASGKSKKRGLCGLRNLGNTCFMNSAIQCLSNTVPLKNYFISGQYAKHINTSNPLGTKGKLANNFASLIKEMWSGGANFTPTNFKYAISQFAPQFSGYNQHDSQELTSYLLDGLHEDLNKVIKKPYIEAKDYDGRPDEVIAKESWEQHLKRNDSVIVDLFQGQLKSTLICNVCNKISVKFDPFMYLSVPLGKSSPHRLDVILLCTENGARATKYSVELPKQSTVQVLATQFAKISGRDPQKLLFFAMNGFAIGRQYSLNDSVKIIDPNAKTTPKVLCADVPDDYSPEKYLIIPMRQRYPAEEGKFKSVGIPFILFVKKEISTKDFYDILWSHLQRVAKKSPEDAETNTQPTQENGQELPLSERIEVLRQTVFPAFDPANIPFKFSVIDKSVEVINDTCGIPILYDDRDDMVKEYLQQDENYLFSVDWFDVKMLKTKETVTVHVAEQNITSEAPRSQNITLDDCLKLNSEMEQLGEKDQWYCPECKKHVCAFKQCCVWSSPEILIIHLKRFGFNRFGREKVNALIDYPIYNLDLSDYMVKKPEDHMLYDLFAISCHTGGLYGGHYYSYAKNCEDSKWYCFNDSSVSPLAEKELKTSNAYMLFYQRKRTVNDVKVEVEFQ